MGIVIAFGTLEPHLGPLPCQSCGRLVVYGVAVQLFQESASGVMGQVRRRDLYDASTEQPHRCAQRGQVAA